MPKHIYGQIGIIYVRTHLLKTRYHNEAVLFIAFRVCDACAVYQGRWSYLMYVKSCASLFWKLIFSTTKRLDTKRYHDPKKFFAYLISFVCFVCVCSMGVPLNLALDFRIILQCICIFHCVKGTSDMGKRWVKIYFIQHYLSAGK